MNGEEMKKKKEIGSDFGSGSGSDIGLDSNDKLFSFFSYLT